MNITARIPCRLFTSLLAAFVSLGCFQACTRKDADESPEQTIGSSDTGESLPESGDDSYDPEVSAEFNLLKQELYERLVSADYLTRHQYAPGPEEAGPGPGFQDLSETGWAEHMELAKSLKFQLGTIDRERLKDDEQFFYDILAFYADHELSLEEMNDFRLLGCLAPDTGLIVRIPRMLNAFPFYQAQDVENYLLLLSDMPRLFKDLADLCRDASGGSIAFTEEWLKYAAAACAPYTLPPEHNSLAASFSRRLEDLPGLTEEERAGYEARNLEALSLYVIPSYQKLSQDIRELPVSPREYEGLCGQKNGREYYRRLTARYSGTAYPNMQALKTAIEEQILQNTRALDELAGQTGLGAGADGSAASPVSDPNQTLRFLEEETKKYFPEIPAALLSVETVPENQEDLWLLPCLEQHLFISRHISQNRGQLYAALSDTGFPGEYYRKTYLKKNPDMPLLSLLGFPGWEKGWDLYGRSYAISFENGLTLEEKQLARLSLSSFMGVRALIDLEVNYYGWGLDAVRDFLSEHYRLQEEEVVRELYRSAVYSPGDNLTEYTGYLEIRQMKAQAIEALGEGFDEKSFHQFLLDTGPAPFSLIRERLQGWILEQSLSSFGK